jgi:hypothetical protein
LLLSFSLPLWLSACSKWTTVKSPSTVLAAQAARPADERDALRLYVGSERVAEGKVEDITPDSVLIFEDSHPKKVAVGEISRIEVRTANDLGSAAIFLGVLAGVAGALLIVALASLDLQ